MVRLQPGRKQGRGEAIKEEGRMPQKRRGRACVPPRPPCEARRLPHEVTSRRHARVCQVAAAAERPAGDASRPSRHAATGAAHALYSASAARSRRLYATARQPLPPRHRLRLPCHVRRIPKVARDERVCRAAVRAHARAARREGKRRTVITPFANCRWVTENGSRLKTPIRTGLSRHGPQAKKLVAMRKGKVQVVSMKGV